MFLRSAVIDYSECQRAGILHRLALVVKKHKDRNPGDGIRAAGGTHKNIESNHRLVAVYEGAVLMLYEVPCVSHLEAQRPRSTTARNQDIK